MTTNATQPADPHPAATEAATDEEFAVADALFTLGHKDHMIVPELAADILGYMRNQHDMVLVPAAAAPPSGQVCVDETELTTLISELIYQHGKLNQSESIGKDTGIVRRLIKNGAAR